MEINEELVRHASVFERVTRNTSLRIPGLYIRKEEKAIMNKCLAFRFPNRFVTKMHITHVYSCHELNPCTFKIKIEICQ